MEVMNLDNTPPFITMDGSEIRELLAHRNSAIRNQSLAEARLPVGGATLEHYHRQTEEIYYITHGTGRISIERELRDVAVGDAIAIRPAQSTSFGTRAPARCASSAAVRPATNTATPLLPKRASPSA